MFPTVPVGVSYPVDPEPSDDALGRRERLTDVDLLVTNDQYSPPELSRTKSALVMVTVSSMVFVGSLLSGILTVGLPRIARDIDLQQNLLLW